MSPTMGATLWQRVAGRSADDRDWNAFAEHYYRAVYAWAYDRLNRDEDLAVTVTADVFSRLRSRLTDPDQPAPTLLNGSFQPYIRKAVENLCKQSRARAARDRPAALSEAVLARLAAPDSLDELGHRVEDWEQVERELPAYAERFRRAAAEVRADPQFDPRTWAVFLRVYRDGAAGDAIDREYAWSRGMARKSARRVRDRVLRVMGFAGETERGEVILRGVLRHDGRAPD